MAAAGTHGDGAATETVRFGVYVPPIVRWALDTGAPGAEATLSIRAGADTGPREASHVFRLMMNVDVLIRAAVTPYRNREDARDELTTYWRIVDDAGGDRSRTGVTRRDAAAAVGYGTYVPTADFLPDALTVTHAPTDGAVELTVTARATPPALEPGAGDVERIYDAYVTLTSLPQTWLALSRPRPQRAASTPRQWR